MSLLQSKFGKKLNYFSLLIILLGIFLLSGQASAKACKEMSKSACSSSDSCSWVNAYTTKKGVKVNSYCRNKAKKSSTKKTANSSKKADTSKKEKTDKKSTSSDKKSSKKDKKSSSKKDKKDKKDKKSSSKKDKKDSTNKDKK